MPISDFYNSFCGSELQIFMCKLCLFSTFKSFKRAKFYKHAELQLRFRNTIACLTKHRYSSLWCSLYLKPKGLCLDNTYCATSVLDLMFWLKESNPESKRISVNQGCQAELNILTLCKTYL